MAHRVNQRQLSEITGVSQVTLWQWQKEGMPYLRAEENGVANEYDTVDVIAWMVARAVTKGEKEAEKDRLTRLQADALQRKFDIEDGLLIPADQIEPAWSSIVLAVRQAMLAQAARLTPLLATMNGDVDAIRDLLEDDVRDTLTKLSQHGDNLDGPEATGAASDASVRPAAEDSADDVGGTESGDARGQPDPGAL